MEEQQRFRDQALTLAGVVGENVEITSANPLNYHQAMTDPAGCEPVVVDGKLFLDHQRQPTQLPPGHNRPGGV